MEQDKKPKAAAPKAAAPAAAKKNNEVVVDSKKCKFQECKKENSQFGFCPEHYELYMAGVIRGDGKKPLDFAEKLEWFKHRNDKRKSA